MKRLTLWQTIALWMTVAACATGGIGTLNKKFVNQYGRRTYTSSYTQTFNGARDAMAICGFNVVLSDERGGKIVTERTLVEEYEEDGTKFYRQYEIRVVKLGQRIEVRVTPKLYKNEREVRWEEKLWDRDEERELWGRYFAELAKFATET